MLIKKRVCHPERSAQDDKLFVETFSALCKHNLRCHFPVSRRHHSRDYGPSGIGFVNFGTVNTFVAKADVETHGLGARGFNQYDGTVTSIKFKSLVTRGDGSIGVQVSKPVGSIEVEEGITTYGSVGNSLVNNSRSQGAGLVLSRKA